MANPNDRGFNTIQNSRVTRRRKNETLQLYTLLGVIGMAVLTIVIVAVMGVGSLVGDDTPGPAGEKVEWGSFTVTATDTLHGDLVIVNNSHAYTFPTTNEHLAEIYTKCASHSPMMYLQSGISTYMDKDALNALDAMLVDFATATGRTNVQIRDAYRTYEQQESKEILPGHSDHHTGLGCALKYLPENGPPAHDLSLDTTYTWLYDNAHKYGFVIRYPEAKADVTGVSDYEEYFRFVGIPHATYMKEQNLCMEEYVNLLKEYDNKNPLKINAADGKYYEVYYVAVDGSATVKYPTNYAYSVSGTNEGGVVITVDRSAAINEADTSADTALGAENP